jgi:hypothetical protein
MGSLYGFELVSELPLARLNRAAGTRGVLTVQAASELEKPSRAPVSILEDDAGWRWYASYVGDGRCLLQLPPSGEFLLEPGELRLTVDSHHDDFELLEHRIASSAISTLLAEHGDLVLHASAVEVDDRAVIFCGPSGRGKSTLARTLGELGHRVLGEDGIAIELGDEGTPTAFPGARGVRVRGYDAQGQPRTSLIADPGPDEPPPCVVAAVVLLGERSGIAGDERLEAARALALLTPNLVHTGSRDAIAGAFARLAQLLAVTPAFRLTFPDDLDALAATAQRFLASTTVRG